MQHWSEIDQKDSAVSLSHNIKIFTLPIKNKCCNHLKPSHLICSENQLTSFYMAGTVANINAV